jgi:hypothetical protein
LQATESFIVWHLSSRGKSTSGVANSEPFFLLAHPLGLPGS